MKKPQTHVVTFGAPNRISKISLQDFDMLQKRVRIFFTESAMSYSVVTTRLHNSSITGLQIRVDYSTSPDVSAMFLFSIFPLPKYDALNNHFVRYEFYINGDIKADTWLSLADREPGPDSLNSVVARDILRAHGENGSLFF